MTADQVFALRGGCGRSTHPEIAVIDPVGHFLLQLDAIKSNDIR